jgi:serine/threonine protein kinase
MPGSKEQLVDFIWVRRKMQVMKDILSDIWELEKASLKLIKYVADLHAHDIFHGDIKPPNIFYD